MSDEKIITLTIPFKVKINADTKEEAIKKVGEHFMDIKEVLRNLAKQKGIELSEEELEAFNSTIISSYIQIDGFEDIKNNKILN
jgi:hypothetical protein